MGKRQPNPYFRFQQFTIFHDKCAMKVGTDGVLLGAWVDVYHAKNALDIGTGTGLIALMMGQRNSQLEIDAIDIDDKAVEQARENIREARFSTQTNVLQTAIQNYSPAKKYDIIVSNPPFFNNSLKSPNEQRTLARHTDSLLAEDLIASASRLLNDDGRLTVIYPFEYKEKLIRLSSQYNLNITKVTNVFPTKESPPKRVLMEISKKRKELIENDLIIEEKRHVHTNQFNDLVKEFYLKK